MNQGLERKLLALKEMADRGTEHEAFIAMKKLQELCLKYGIDSGELGRNDRLSIEMLIEGKAIPNWKKILATAVAEGCGAYCFVVRRNGMTIVRISGLSYQQTVVATQYRYLVAIVDRLAAENASGTSDRHDYRMGVVTRLWEKLSPRSKKREKTDSFCGEEGLVLLSSSISTAKSHAESIAGSLRSSRLSVRGSDAYNRGRQQGDRINTSAPLGNGYALPSSR